MNDGGRTGPTPLELAVHRALRRQHHPVDHRRHDAGRPPGRHRRLASVRQQRREQPAHGRAVRDHELPATITATPFQARRHHHLQRLRRRLHVVQPGHRHRRRRRQPHPAGDRRRRLHPRAWSAWSGSRTTTTTCAACRSPKTAPPSHSPPRPRALRPPALPALRLVGRQAATWRTTCCSSPTTPRTPYFIRKVTLDPRPQAPELGLQHRSGHVHPAGLGGRPALLRPRGGRPHRQRAARLAASRQHPAAGLATYFGGPGTQTGLLQSPTALAVTNPGVGADPRGRRPNRSLRPQRQPRQVLRRGPAHSGSSHPG